MGILDRFHLPTFKRRTAADVGAIVRQATPGAGSASIGSLTPEQIIPMMYAAWSTFGYQPSTTFYQLANMYTSWVYTAIEKKARTIAGLPKHVYRFEKKASGKSVPVREIKAYFNMNDRTEKRRYLKNMGMDRVEVEDHPLIDLMDNPNDHDIEFSFWHKQVVILELAGAVGIYKVRDGLRVPRRLEVLPATWTGELKPIPGNDGINVISGYRLLDQNINTLFPLEDIVWMKYNSLRNPYEGMSPLKAQLSAYSTDSYLLQQQSNFFKNDAILGNVLTTDKDLTTERFRQLLADVRTSFEGSTNSGQAKVLHSGLKMDKSGQATGREMMIDVVSQLARDRILSAYDVSAGKIGLTDHTNRSNMETVNENYIAESIHPTTLLITQYLNKGLAADFDPRLAIDFDLPHFEQSEKKITERQANLGAFVTTINEERAQDDMEPVEWGDKPWIPFNMTQYGAPKSEPKPITVPTEEESPKETPPKSALASETKALTSESWTKERKDAYWKMKDKTATSFEPLFVKIMKAHFKTQCDYVLEKLPHTGIKIKGHIAGMSPSNTRHWLKDNKMRLEEVNINKGEWASKLRKALEPAYHETMKGSAEQVAKDLFGAKNLKANEYAFEFNVNDPRVKKYIGNRLKDTSATIEETTFANVQKILRDDFEAGEPLAKMSEHIKEQFSAAESYRADAIARTETTAACSKADIEAVEQMGLKDKMVKAWLNEPGARDTHVKAGDFYKDGIDIDEDFNVGDDTMDAPGNGDLAEENVNCRCTLIFQERA